MWVLVQPSRLEILLYSVLLTLKLFTTHALLTVSGLSVWKGANDLRSLTRPGLGTSLAVLQSCASRSLVQQEHLCNPSHQSK